MLATLDRHHRNVLQHSARHRRSTALRMGRSWHRTTRCDAMVCWFVRRMSDEVDADVLPGNLDPSWLWEQEEDEGKCVEDEITLAFIVTYIIDHACGGLNKTRIRSAWAHCCEVFGKVAHPLPTRVFHPQPSDDAFGFFEGEFFRRWDMLGPTQLGPHKTASDFDEITRVCDILNSELPARYRPIFINVLFMTLEFI